MVTPHFPVPIVEVSAAEKESIYDLSRLLATSEWDPQNENSLVLAARLGNDLPPRIHAAMTTFRLTGRSDGGLLLRGLPILPHEIGYTPTDFLTRPVSVELDRIDAMLLLLTGVLGDPFSFATQQLGRIILNVFPVREHQYEQLGSGSTTKLEWHNEDAFHNRRADWLGLLCLRNHEGATTHFANTKKLSLNADTFKLLSEKRFVISPDVSHLQEFNETTTGLLDDSGGWSSI